MPIDLDRKPTPEEACKGCNSTEFTPSEQFNCQRCGTDICPECSDNQVHCRDCEMSIFSGEDDL